MKKLFLLFYAVSISLTQQAQDNECIKDFDYIIKRVQNDYPGYKDKVSDQNVQELREFEKDLRKKMIAYPDSCKDYFDAYLSWFKDNHLTVTFNSENNNSNKVQPIEKKYFIINPKDQIKPKEGIEGIWTGFWGDFAIIKQEKNKYLGVSISYEGYDKNQVIFECLSIGNDKYHLTSYWEYRDFKPYKEFVSLHLNQSVLEIHNYVWFVKRTNNHVFDKSVLATYRPEYPNGLRTYPVALYLSDSTFYLRITNFYSDLTEKLLTKHWEDIVSRPNLIIDIRNNNGGQTYYYEKLAKLIYSGPYESKGVEWYATKGNIEDLENDIKNGRIKPGFEQEAEALLKQMQANVGEYVIHPYHIGDKTIKQDTVYLYPKKIGIIINENNASAAEQFILMADHSSKVITFGNKNTAGVLDYSNKTPKELPSGKYNLLLPVTRSRRLPEYPIDNIGIEPDIKIPFKPLKQLYDSLDDWVYFVKNYLENKE